MLNIFGIQLSSIIWYSSLYLGLIYMCTINPGSTELLLQAIMELHRVKNNISSDIRRYR